jgi:PAS domain S-box-containing protein
MQFTAPRIPVVGHDHFRLIFMHSQDAILLLDIDANRIVEANPRAAEILGYELEKLLETPVSAIHPDEMAGLRRFAAGVIESASGWTDELTCTTRLCDRIPAEISASAVEVDGRVLVLAMIRDITARRRADAEKELLVERERAARRDAEDRQALLERVEQSRARLVRGFAHDVKNPLGAADGRLQLLRDGFVGTISSDQHDTIEKARRSIRNALDLIDDLIEVARAEAGQLEITAGPLRVEPLIAELVEEYRAPAEKKGLRLEQRLSSELPFVESDRRRVRQIMGNLLSNAIKYSLAGGRIEVEADCCTRPGAAPGDWVCLTVRDGGPGIAVEQQALLFREFSRIEPGATDGAGLGLAISHRIATALGGDLTIRSESGAGSAFTIWLPTCLQREQRIAEVQ